MSLDGRFAHFLAQELNSKIENGRIQKIYQLTKNDFVFQIRAGRENLSLSLSLSTSLARIHLTKFQVEKPETPSGFCMLLRKYLEGAFILSFQTLGMDRIFEMRLQNISEIGDMTDYSLYLEIMGRYANLVVVQKDGTIIDAFHHVSPFGESDRTILRGAKYTLPEDGKKFPEDLNSVQSFFLEHPDPTYKDLVSTFRGFSPFLAKSILAKASRESISPQSAFLDIMNLPVLPTHAILEEKSQFYYCDLFPEVEKRYYPTLSDLLDAVFMESSKMERVKQMSKNVYQLAKRELEKNKNKLEKLTTERDEAISGDLFRRKGDLIRQYLPTLNRGDATLEALDYETNETWNIALDQLLSPIENANAYYKKYRKSKTAIGHLDQQIDITKKQILYFDVLVSQIENASVSDIDEIVDELAEKGYRRAKKTGKRKKSLPAYDQYESRDGILVLVGKNNLQNEYLTHKLAMSNEWWFHTKDIHGSHVIVRSDKELSEDTIRMASMLAAFHSSARLSSSVPVDYTRVRNVKKIPGELGSLVTYTQHKTIYIDPDPDKIAAMPKRKNGKS